MAEESDPPGAVILPLAGSARWLAGITASVGVVFMAIALSISALFVWMSGGRGWWAAGCAFGPFIEIGAGLVVLGWHIRRLRWAPLVIDSDGRVLYRGKALFGSVGVLVVRHVVSYDEAARTERYKLYADAEAREAEFPSPYFTGFSNRQEAEAVANRVAEALRIGVTWIE